MIEKEKIIQNYIEGYNQFDIDKMIADFDESVIFENIQNGEINLTLNGIKEFSAQAEKGKEYFSARKQTITSIKQDEITAIIDIDYYAVLAIDFPNGLKAGQELNMKGKSIFQFLDDKIVKLTDIS
ncbi:nuclear transport factor 2 family protein [Flavobacterium ginsenosidimutans]|uniref:Nuclear transport factor 2 family protein n=1 Tax=Flavobacterium ginsenosidimutans TaxID=687844 RepID=A0ABZ2QDQ6_9FLAO|nr:nuclear transport factor 2 family protein [Flavobacterium ginsenosidimutans]KAF2331130.1 nuclear transport factor 2 family protein [Flavobacterium ginsenosidimutans]